jgi:hypothetical protein
VINIRFANGTLQTKLTDNNFIYLYNIARLMVRYSATNAKPGYFPQPLADPLNVGYIPG